MTDFNLSEHFMFSELTTTEHTEFLEQNQREGMQFVASLTKVCTDLLEPIRVQWGPIHINSGFRCAVLNAAVGSHPTSQHLLGQAVDFIIKDLPAGRTLIDVFDWIHIEYTIDFHQLINEGHGEWIHVSLPLGVNDKQVLLYDVKSEKYFRADGSMR